MKAEENIVKRFSENQTKLSESIKSLITLYYKTDYSQPRNKWPRRKIYQSIGETIHEAIGGKWTYRNVEEKKGVEFILIPNGDSSSENIISNTYLVNDKMIEKSISIIGEIIDLIKEQKFSHLKFVGFAEKIKTELKPTEDLDVSDNNSIDEQSNRKLQSHSKDVIRQVTPLLDKSIIKTIKRNIAKDVLKDDCYSADVIRKRQYRVMQTSDFGKKLLSRRTSSRVKMIKHFSSPEINNFRKLVYYIIIHFHIEFDGLERLKICKNCGKLFFEKKIGARQYCGNPCRKRRYDASEDVKKKRCRDRQNQWAERNGITNRCYRDDHCEKCKIKPLPTKSGYCPLIK